MSQPTPLASRLWLIVPICAVGFLVWLNSGRIAHVDYVSGLAGSEVTVEAASPTGYADGRRHLIVPEPNSDSFQWIIQTQEMLARRVWHLTQVGYDNAPIGREVGSPSPYRWWLGLVAQIDHAFTDQPLGLAVERAALYADPLLQILLLIATAIFVARQFGSLAGMLVSLGLAGMFPLGGEFLPGQPTDHGLALAAALWSILPLLAAGRERSSPSVDRWFFLAGVAGGFGLWISVERELPVLAGVVVGGLVLIGLARRSEAGHPGESAAGMPWSSWACGGATASLVAYLLESLPSRLGGFHLQTIHPLYALAWLGIGEIMMTLGRLFQSGPLAWTKRRIGLLGLAGLAVAAAPVAIHLSGNQPFFADNSLASRLTNLPDSAVAPNVWAWISSNGVSLAVAATLLPLLLIGPAGWLIARHPTAPAWRAMNLLALGPVLVVFGCACFQLHWWSELDVLLLALLVAITAAPDAPGRSEKIRRGMGAAVVALGLVPGLIRLSAQLRPEAREVVTPSEVRELMERDLAYWLAHQSGTGAPVVLAPPNLTTALIFYGGIRGLGTPYWENKAGFAAAVRIAGARSPDEAQIVARGRNLTHILLPSWDPFVDEYARLGSGRVETSLIGLLHHWLPPRWLRPVAYNLPKVAGMEEQSLVIFTVIDVQDNAVALSRLAEYFVEMNQPGEAAAVSQALARLFPADLGALVARTLVDKALNDRAATAEAVTALEGYLARGDDGALPWDRRVSLAIALAEGRAFEPARAQARRCLAEMDESLARSLSDVALYRLLVLAKAFHLPGPDQHLRELTRQLLPSEMRDSL
jgi:hypothetical protein